MKISISIDDKLFNKAEKLSEKLHLSISQLFSQALEFFIQKSDSTEIIKKLNEIYENKGVLKEQETIAAYSKKKIIGIIQKW